MNNETYNLGGMHHQLEGAFKVAVVDAKTDEIVWSQTDWHKNLILNAGMNKIVSTTYAGMFGAGIVGTGTRTNSAPGNNAVVSQTGTTLTLTTDPTFLAFTQSLGGYSQALEVGDVIVFATGSGGTTNVLVTGGIGGTSCTVNKSVSLTNNNFTIWKTSATGLQNEVKRADGNQIANTAVISGQGNCGTTFVGNIISMQKTWDFAPEVSLVNYTEVGVGWSYIGPGSTFSRLLLPSTLPVDAGQKIRLSYQLQVSVYPTASIARPDATITGWTQVSPSGSTTQGSESIQMVLSGGPSGIGQFNYAQIQYLDYGGAVQGYSSLDPSSAGNNCSFFIATNSQSLQTFNSAIDRTGISVNGTSGFAGMYSDQGTLPYQNPYVANSFTVNKTATFGLYTMSGNSNIRSMGFGYSYQVAGYDYSTQVPYQAFCFVFDYNQYKASTQTLTLSYTWAWDRTYVA